MDIQIQSFYALRSRLYAAAAAGCGVIAEDFRLQRATEDFAPLAAANKAFAKLHAMCSKLPTAEDPALLLTDCIALADALAVTQGTFQDDRPAEIPYPVEGFAKHPIPAREFEEMRKAISSRVYNFNPDPVHFEMAAHDPRMLAEYIANSHKNDALANDISLVFEGIYGQSLIPFLMDAIDMQNPRSTGQQIRCLRRLGGASLRGYFRETAQNEQAPPDVRIRAAEALADFPEEAETLLTLWQTGKGKLKTAALTSLLTMNSPLSDEPLKKQLAKLKEANIPLVAAGNTPLCNEYAVHHVLLAITASAEEHFKPEEAVEMLANKPDVAEICIRTAIYAEQKHDDRLLHLLNWVIAKNLFLHPQEKLFQALILRLYAQKPNAFFPARLFLAFAQSPETAMDDLRDAANRHLRQTSAVLELIRITPGQGWHLRYASSRYIASARTDEEYLRIPLFDSLPASLLHFFRQNPAFRNSMDEGTAAGFYNCLNRMLDGCKSDERAAVQAAAADFAEAALYKVPTPNALAMLAKTGADLTGKTRLYVLRYLETHQRALRYYQITVLASSVPVQMAVAELRGLRGELPLRKDFPQHLKDEQDQEIERALDYLSRQ